MYGANQGGILVVAHPKLKSHGCNGCFYAFIAMYHADCKGNYAVTGVSSGESFVISGKVSSVGVVFDNTKASAVVYRRSNTALTEKTA